MTARTGAELPIYFGAHALFGLYHPAGVPKRRGAVLLCPPIGQDQIRSHRLYRQLAQALAEDGHSVLRYDCRGTGDSPGESVDADWQQCVEDTVCAADELRRLSGFSELAAFGARLGGSLALVAAKPARFARVIAWDAVLDGGALVAQLDAWQEQLRHESDRFRKPRSAADAANQWVGFPVSDMLRAQLAALRVEPAGVHTLLLQSAGARLGTEYTRLLAAGALEASLPVSAPWEDLAALEATVLSPELIKVACAALRGQV